MSLITVVGLRLKSNPITLGQNGYQMVNKPIWRPCSERPAKDKDYQRRWGKAIGIQAWDGECWFIGHVINGQKHGVPWSEGEWLDDQGAAQEVPDLTGQVQSVRAIRPANSPSCEERLPEPQANPAAPPAAAHHQREPVVASQALPSGLGLSSSPDKCPSALSG